MDERRPQVDDAGEDVAEERSLLGQIRLWTGIAGAALLAAFLLSNLDKVAVQFLWLEWDVPLIFALIASAILGGLTTMLVGFFRGRARRAELEAQLAIERQRERQQKR